MNKIATLTGGRAAEELVFGSITTGASNDIEQATKLARGDDHPLRHEPTNSTWWRWRPSRNQYLGGDTSLACSAEHRRADRPRGHRDRQGCARKGHQNSAGQYGCSCIALAHHLLEKETITGDEFMSML